MASDTSKDDEQELELVAAYRAAFASKEGQLVLEHLRSACWVDQSMAADLNATEDLFYREGQRSIFLLIQEMKAEDPVETPQESTQENEDV